MNKVIIIIIIVIIIIIIIIIIKVTAYKQHTGPISFYVFLFFLKLCLKIGVQLIQEC